jgi:hypothetical protein
MSTCMFTATRSSTRNTKDCDPMFNVMSAAAEAVSELIEADDELLELFLERHFVIAQSLAAQPTVRPHAHLDEEKEPCIDMLGLVNMVLHRVCDKIGEAPQQLEVQTRSDGSFIGVISADVPETRFRVHINGDNHLVITERGKLASPETVNRLTELINGNLAIQYSMQQAVPDPELAEQK